MSETCSIDLNMATLEDEGVLFEQKQEFLSQIEELQHAVQTMKNAFTTAQLQLVSIGLEDKSLHDEMKITRTQCQQQSGEILSIVLSLKSEILSLREALETTQLITHGLESRLQKTLLERDILLDELAKNGAISQQLRDKLYSCEDIVRNGIYSAAVAGRSSSGSQSTNDSGVALYNLLTDFHNNGKINNDHIGITQKSSSTVSHSSSANNLNNSATTNLNGGRLFSFNTLQLLNDNLDPTTRFPDEDSKNSSITHVQSYLDTLNHHHHDIANGNQINTLGLHNDDENHTDDYPSLNSNTTVSTSSTSNNNRQDHEVTSEESRNRRRSTLVYDSDSSLVVAAAKSLTLSTSLSKQCGLELDQHHNQQFQHQRENDNVVEKNQSYNYKKKKSSSINHLNNEIRPTKEIEDVVEEKYSNSVDNELQDSSSSTSTSKRMHRLDNNVNHHQEEEKGNEKEAIEPFVIVTSKKKDLLVGSKKIDDVEDKVNFTVENDDQQQQQEKLKNNNAHLNNEESQRLKVAKELVETERKYCHTLKTIQEIFALPLKESQILTIRDINTLFPEEVGLMYGKHCQFLGQLEQRISDWNAESNIGDLLEKFTRLDGSNVLRLYTCYVNDFPEVLKTFHKLCRSNGEFISFLKQCLEKPACSGLDLGAYLLTPVQRMPRYILLLKQMMKWTNSEHKDYEYITICLNRLRDYLTKLNDSMEHSFQLVTAQIIPQQREQPRRNIVNNNAANNNNSDSCSKRNSLLRSSLTSESSTASAGSSGNSNDINDRSMSNIPQKIRYKRSVSASRSGQNECSGFSNWMTPRRDSSSSICNKINKLKSKSKSDWAVCKKGNCRNETTSTCGNCNINNGYEANFMSPQHNSSGINSPRLGKQLLERSISDSDISDGDDEIKGNRTNKYQVSKSMYDFMNGNNSQESADAFDWTISEPSLCLSDSKSGTFSSSHATEGKSVIGRTVFRKSTLLRPFLPPPPTTPSSLNRESQLVRIERGSQPELSQKGKKKLSLRASIKNIFSLKKRGSRTLEISQPITYSPQSEIAWNTNTKLKEDKSLGNVSLNSIVMRGFD